MKRIFDDELKAKIDADGITIGALSWVGVNILSSYFFVRKKEQKFDTDIDHFIDYVIPFIIDDRALVEEMKNDRNWDVYKAWVLAVPEYKDEPNGVYMVRLSNKDQKVEIYQ